MGCIEGLDGMRPSTSSDEAKSEWLSIAQSAWSMGEKAKMEGYNRTGLSAKLKLIEFFFPPLVGGIEGGGKRTIPFAWVIAYISRLLKIIFEYSRQIQ